MDFYEIREELMQGKDVKYREFNAKIVATKMPMIGVRMPLVKKIAAKGGADYLDCIPQYYEEILVHGLIAGRLFKTAQTLFEHTDKFLSYCDNWAAIDTVTMSMKAFKKDAAACFEKLQKYVADDREFYCRFAAVAMLSHYINDEYCDRVLQTYKRMPAGNYYTDMAVAWGLSVAAVKFYGKTVPLIEAGAFSSFVTDKALSKCLDSFRLDKEQKAEIRELKRKLKEKRVIE